MSNLAIYLNLRVKIPSLTMLLLTLNLIELILVFLIKSILHTFNKRDFYFVTFFTLIESLMRIKRFGLIFNFTKEYTEMEISFLALTVL